MRHFLVDDSDDSPSAVMYIRCKGFSVEFGKHGSMRDEIATVTARYGEGRFALEWVRCIADTPSWKIS